MKKYCGNCIHCVKSTTPWWLEILGKESEWWCAIGNHLSGQCGEIKGTKCRIMRTTGICGIEAELYEEK